MIDKHMRYLIFLIGLDVNSKTEFDDCLKTLPYSKMKYIHAIDGCVIHLETDVTNDVIKLKIAEITEKFFCWYFLTEFPEKMTCNLKDDDAKYLFDLDYDVDEDEVEFDFNFIEEEEDDDDDNDLVQMLKDKFSVKRIEPTLDEILDKINQKGVTSLSIQEQAILKSYN
jgi:hypothetical protein